MRRALQSVLFALLAGALALPAPPAAAQTATATIRGKVTDDRGAARGGAGIEATGPASGYVQNIAAGSDGSFQLGGLTPGEYTVTVTATGFEPRAQKVRVLVGQNLELNLVLSAAEVV